MNEQNKACCCFYKLVPVQNADAKSLEEKIIQTFSEDGIGVEMLKERLVGFGSDGAAVFNGKKEARIRIKHISTPD